MIDTLLGVAQKLFGLKSDFDKATRERKDRVAQYFSNLAQTIEDAAAMLRRGQYPGGKCAELLVHAQQMETTIGDLIGAVEAKSCADEVLKVWEIEQLYGELSALSPTDRDQRLSQLELAAGRFRGIAAHLRV